MPSEIQSSYGAATAFVITLDALADTGERQSTQVTTVTGPQVRIWATIVTDSSADVNSLVEFYIARTDGTIQTGGGGASDAAWTGDKNTVQFVHALVVQAGAATYKCSFLVDDPGPSFHVIVSNETSAALGSGCSMRYRSITPEVQ